MDNQNLRPEQLEALAEAMDLIDESTVLLHSGNLKDANNKIHDARGKVNLVFAGDRDRELGPAI